MKLVNLSRGGALIEVAARFPMRSRVRLKLTPATGEVTVAEGRVAWAKVAAIADRQVNYLVAVIFDQPLAESLLPKAAGSEPGSDPAFDPERAGSDDEDLTSIIIEARDNLTQFPSAGSRAPERSPVQEASRELTALGHPIGAIPDPLDDDLQARLAAASADIAALSADKRILEARLAEADQQRTASRAELEAAQRRFDEERSRIEQEAAAAVARADTLIAELLQTANDQQVEYQQMLDERTAARDEQAARAEHHETELARQRAGWDGQRVELEARLGALEARLEAAEALCAAHVARAASLQAEAEKLLSLIASPMVPDAGRAQDAAQPTGAAGGAAQAVA